MCVGGFRDLLSFADAEDLVQQFRDLLARHGIKLCDDSDLGVACGAMTSILLKHWDSALRDPRADIREEFRDALAVHALVHNALGAAQHPDFAQLLDHFGELAKGGVRQNQWTNVLDRIAPKVFELLIALAAMNMGTGLELDHPTKSSRGTNPDVIVTIDGQRWAFACKMLNTFAPGAPAKVRAYFDNILDGVRQINNATVDHGMVVVSMKNVIDHERAWPLRNAEAFKHGAEPEYDSYHSAEEITDLLATESRALHQAMLDEVGEENVLALFKNGKARPVVVQYLHTVGAVTCRDRTMATPLAFLFARIDDVGLPIATLLNRALQHRA
jgi:hypothetical protein